MRSNINQSFFCQFHISAIFISNEEIKEKLAEIVLQKVF